MTSEPLTAASCPYTCNDALIKCPRANAFNLTKSFHIKNYQNTNDTFIPLQRFFFSVCQSIFLTLSNLLTISLAFNLVLYKTFNNKDLNTLTCTS